MNGWLRSALGWRARRIRAAWEASLVWFRLRYPGSTGAGATGAARCLALLSRPEACGRIALDYRPGEAVATLHLGVPAARVRLVQQLAADFGLLLRPAASEYQPLLTRPLRPAGCLRWNRPFAAHLAGGCLFVDDPDEPGRAGWWPLPTNPGSAGVETDLAWPAEPPAGLSSRPSLSPEMLQPPRTWLARRPAPTEWPLGWTADGFPVQLPGRLHVYGRADAAAAWLVPLVVQLLSAPDIGERSGLVVLDGRGDLVPQLKRQPAVTRLLGRGLLYLDLDKPNESDSGGFNPLAATPGEPEGASWQRRQRWFAGMGVPAEGLALLCQAWQAGVGDIPALRHWLRRPARQWQATAVAGVAAVLDRLAADPAVQEWLAWPAPAVPAPDTALLAFAGRTWARQQLLRAAYLAASVVADRRLVLHGLPWDVRAADGVELGPVVVSPGHPTAGRLDSDDTGVALVVVVQADEAAAATLAGRFGPDEPGEPSEARLAENLQLLGLGEGIVLASGRSCFVRWHAGPTGETKNG